MCKKLAENSERLSGDATYKAVQGLGCYTKGKGTKGNGTADQIKKYVRTYMHIAIHMLLIFSNVGNG